MKAKKIIKIAGITLGSIVGLFIIALTVVYFVSKDEFDEKEDVLNRLRDNALSLLRESAPYDFNEIDTIQFNYQDKNDPELVGVYDHFRLDTLIVDDEIQTIKNLMYFVHNAIGFDGGCYYDKACNSIALYEFYKETGNKINCRMMATTLNEIYLAAGFSSHFITCMPADTLNTDCHVINSVWSKSLNKWLWIDPSFAAWVEDGDGHMLSIAEVRERLIKGQKVQTNSDINVNGDPYDGEYYLQKYMARYLYWFNVWSESRFNLESLDQELKGTYVVLTPVGYDLWKRSWNSDIKNLETHNPDCFWQAPFGQ